MNYTFRQTQSPIPHCSTRGENRRTEPGKKRGRSRHLEEGPRIRAEELLDLRVLGQDLPAARRVRLVRVRPEEVRRHHPFVRLHPRAHCSLPLAPRMGGGPRTQRQWHGVAPEPECGWVDSSPPFPTGGSGAARILCAMGGAVQAAAEGGRFVYCRESGRGGGDDDHERALAGRERDAGRG